MPLRFWIPTTCLKWLLSCLNRCFHVAPNILPQMLYKKIAHFLNPFQGFLSKSSYNKPSWRDQPRTLFSSHAPGHSWQSLLQFSFQFGKEGYEHLKNQRVFFTNSSSPFESHSFEVMTSFVDTLHGSKSYCTYLFKGPFPFPLHFERHGIAILSQDLSKGVYPLFQLAKKRS